MRLAIFSDVHANLIALEAVLGDARRRGVEGMIHLGDLVGYGPRPDETVELARAEDLSGVAGDWDLAVCEQPPGTGAARSLETAPLPAARASYLWTRARVRPETLRDLAELPAQLRVEERDTVYLFAHASPRSPNEALCAETGGGRLAEVFEATGAQVLVVGHTHTPQASQVANGVVLNPGSVGTPSGGDPRASYLVLDTDRGFVVEHVRVEFDVETAARDVVTFGLPTELAERLRLGRGVR